MCVCVFSVWQVQHVWPLDLIRSEDFDVFLARTALGREKKSKEKNRTSGYLWVELSLYIWNRAHGVCVEILISKKFNTFQPSRWKDNRSRRRDEETQTWAENWGLNHTCNYSLLYTAHRTPPPPRLVYHSTPPPPRRKTRNSYYKVKLAQFIWFGSVPPPPKLILIIFCRPPFWFYPNLD